MSRSTNCLPNGVECLEPAVRGGFVPHTAPDPLLGIQGGLVPRQVVQVQPGMGLQEALHLGPAVPASAIDVQPNRVPFEAAIEMSKSHQKPSAIPSGRSHHALASQEGRHPSRQIESLAVLARSRNPQALSALGPAPAHPGMQGEASLILKDEGLVRAQRREFFLPSAESVGPRRPVLADRHGWPVLAGSPTGASISGPGGPSARSRTGASGGPPTWGHPIVLGGGQTPAGTAPSARPGPVAPAVSTAGDAPAEASTGAPRARPR